MTVGGALDLAAAAWGPRTALVEFGAGSAPRRWTFDELRLDALRVARAMLERCRPGEHVAVWAANLPEWVLPEMGAAYAGVTLVTVNPAYLVGELKHVLGQSRCSGAIVQDTYRGATSCRSSKRLVPSFRRSATSSPSPAGTHSWPRATVPRAAARGAGRHRPDPVHLRHHGHPKGAELLFTHPQVADVSVVGLPRPGVEREGGRFHPARPMHLPERRRLGRFSRRHLARYKTPRAWQFLDSFPWTTSGKIQKFVLRENYLAQLSAGRAGSAE